jgi:large subunit ribosomal protein L15
LPIQKRMPYKRGFTNIFKTQWEVVNLGSLTEFDLSGDITPETLYAAGLIRGLEFPVKILANGEIEAKVNVSAHGFSAAAKQAIEEKGGTATLLERDDRWVEARPRSRRLPINGELKRLGFGKAGGIQDRDDLAGNE